MCICPEGYRQVLGTDKCEDLDECQLDPAICENGRCRNIPGSHTCDCYDGFVLSYDRK